MKLKDGKVITSEGDIKLRGPVFAATSDGVIAASEQIKDLTLNMSQHELNKKFNDFIGTGGQFSTDDLWGEITGGETTE